MFFYSVFAGLNHNSDTDESLELMSEDGILDLEQDGVPHNDGIEDSQVEDPDDLIPASQPQVPQPPPLVSRDDPRTGRNIIPSDPRRPPQPGMQLSYTLCNVSNWFIYFR